MARIAYVEFEEIEELVAFEVETGLGMRFSGTPNASHTGGRSSSTGRSDSQRVSRCHILEVAPWRLESWLFETDTGDAEKKVHKP